MIKAITIVFNFFMYISTMASLLTANPSIPYLGDLDSMIKADPFWTIICQEYELL